MTESNRYKFATGKYQLLSLVLLGVFIIGALVSGFGTVYLAGHNAYDSINYYLDTEEARRLALQDAFNIAEQCYTEGDAFNGVYQYRTPDETNLSVEIIDYETNQLVYRNFTVEEELRSDTFYFVVNRHDETEYYYYDSPTNMGDFKTLYAVKYRFPKTLYAHDYYYNGTRVFSRFFEGRHILLISYAICMIMIFTIVIYLIYASGHQEGTNAIKLTHLDEIPLDLYIIVFIFCLYYSVQWILNLYGSYTNVTGYGTTYHSYTFSGLIHDGTRVMLVVLLLSYYLLSIILTMTTRFKNKTLFQTTLTYSFLSWAKNMAMSSALMPAGFFVMIGFWGLFYYCLRYLNQPILLVILAICSILGAVWMVDQLYHLTKAGEEIANHDYDYDVNLDHLQGHFKKHGENLQRISASVKKAVENEMKSELFKTELITNVSHDIKTPLTSIINYSELLQQPTTEEERQEYLETLNRNGKRLKTLIEDLIEASKASTGNMTVNLEAINVNEIINQAVSEYELRLKENDLEVVVNSPESIPAVSADGRLLWRILSNLLSNCVKYAQPHTRVYIDVVEKEENKVSITVKNTSKNPLNMSSDEYLERFVRGDVSRTSEGNGLGLNIAQSLAELQNGQFVIDIDGDLFKAEVILEAIRPE